MKAATVALFSALFGLALVACGSEAGDAGVRSSAPFSPAFHEEGYPERLSDWNVVRADGETLRIARDAFAYDLATPLFTDYALKLRTISIPAGAAAVYDADDVFAFPVGTVITKTFYYVENPDGSVTDAGGPALVDGALPVTSLRLMETRVLAHRAEGWVAIPYVWNDEQTEAVLKRTGAVARLKLARDGAAPAEFPYIVPNQNQCAGCHAPNNTTRALSPIGPKARHLNRPSPYHGGVGQLELMQERELLEAAVGTVEAAPANAIWDDVAAPVDARARAYLDANCSHCHNSAGPADTSGLDLTPAASGPALGWCKSPIAAGDGTGGRAFDIVPGDPDASILLFRMETTNPAAMMPELGRALSHNEGVALIRDWILAMEGDCA